MRYLVTGGAGFLGTNLCLNLLDEGHVVVAMDDLSTAYEKNLKLLSEKKNFSFVKHDIIEPLPESGRFDFIYNLACPASPPRYQKDPLKTLRTSLWGVWNVLNYAKQSKTPVLHSSTSEIYGDPLENPQKEGYRGNVNPIGKRACYDEGKRAAETLLFDFHRMSGHPVKVVRIFNTYGPHMDPEDGRVMSNFIIQSIKGKPLTVYGSGKQTRSFCYVDDMIQALRMIEKTDASFTGPINLGNPDEISILELISIIEKKTGKKAKIEHLEIPEDDPEQRQPDISFAESALGWKPKVTMESGIEKTIEYFRSINP